MEFWKTTWEILFFAASILFYAIALTVTVRAFSDVVRHFLSFLGREEEPR